MSNALETLERTRDRIQAGDGPVQPGQPLAFTTAAVAGDCIKQGDVNFIVADEVPEGYHLEDRPKSQLARGDNRGARHILTNVQRAHDGAIDWSETGVEVFLPDTETMLGGPCLKCHSEVTVEHPTHGTVTILPGMIVCIHFQQNLDEVTKEARRAQD